MFKRLLLLASIVLLVAACASFRRHAGTGDVAFRLAWNGMSDLDLLVEDPSGNCIFFENRSTKNGGILDIDCNSGTGNMCDQPVENVFWPQNSAPQGTYRFWVHAHALAGVEAPLRFQLQVLRGEEPLWTSVRAMRKHHELLGPFVYSYPGRKVIGPVTGQSLPAGCSGPAHGVMAE